MEIRYYLSPGGANPVLRFIESLPSKEAQLIGAALLDIAEHGLDGTVDRKPIQGKLWELRLAQNRIFYVLLTGPVMVLLHAYKKQSQKAPRRELDVALARLKEVTC